MGEKTWQEKMKEDLDDGRAFKTIIDLAQRVHSARDDLETLEGRIVDVRDFLLERIKDLEACVAELGKFHGLVYAPRAAATDVRVGGQRIDLDEDTDPIGQPGVFDWALLPGLAAEKLEGQGPGLDGLINAIALSLPYSDGFDDWIAAGADMLPIAYAADVPWYRILVLWLDNCQLYLREPGRDGAPLTDGECARALMDAVYTFRIDINMPVLLFRWLSIAQEALLIMAAELGCARGPRPRFEGGDSTDDRISMPGGEG